MTCEMEATQAHQYLVVRIRAVFSSRATMLVLPGCSVESTTFFAYHRSGVIAGILFCLYCAMRVLALSRPAEPASSVLSTISG